MRSVTPAVYDVSRYSSLSSELNQAKEILKSRDLNIKLTKPGWFYTPFSWETQW